MLPGICMMGVILALPIWLEEALLIRIAIALAEICLAKPTDSALPSPPWWVCKQIRPPKAESKRPMSKPVTRLMPKSGPKLWCRDLQCITQNFPVFFWLEAYLHKMVGSLLSLASHKPDFSGHFCPVFKTSENKSSCPGKLFKLDMDLHRVAGMCPLDHLLDLLTGRTQVYRDTHNLACRQQRPTWSWCHRSSQPIEALSHAPVTS